MPKIRNVANLIKRTKKIKIYSKTTKGSEQMVNKKTQEPYNDLLNGSYFYYVNIKQSALL